MRLKSTNGIEMGASEDCAGANAGGHIDAVSMGEYLVIDHDAGAVEKIPSRQIVVTLWDLGEGHIGGVEQVW
jgi:hypothetical protein